VASGRPLSVNYLFDKVKRVVGREIEATYLEKRKGDVLKTYADISKADVLLGWQPITGFYEGLRKTADWFKEN